MVAFWPRAINPFVQQNGKRTLFLSGFPSQLVHRQYSGKDRCVGPHTPDPRSSKQKQLKETCNDSSMEGDWIASWAEWLQNPAAKF